MSQRESRDDVVDQELERGVHRVVAVELRVEVPGEHLDVAGLVHHLRRRVVLGVDPRDGLDDLRGADERALLAVEELAHPPVERLDRELRPLALGPRLQRRAVELDETLAEVRDRAPAISLATASTSTSIDQSRSVEPFHCDVFARS